MNTKVDVFFAFEISNKLFDYKDKCGFRPWESVRYYVGSRVINSIPPIPSVHKDFSYGTQLISFMRHFIRFVFYCICHRHSNIMFIICSRDKKNGYYFDKICGDLLELANDERNFVIETNWHKNNYRYKGKACFVNFMLPILRRIIKINFDFNPIYNSLKCNFPIIELELKELENWHKEFIVQYYLYKFMIRMSGVKKIFFIQNGIMKGLMAAAQSLNVELIEFQHGQISRNHFAYSYPTNDKNLSSKIYHPNQLLTFGSFWSKNRCYPGVKDLVIGNKNYSSPITHSQIGKQNNILVISDIFEGEKLMKFVKGILDIDKDFHFYFKLHPNQYHQFDEYVQLFDSYLNVDVISDAKSVNDLLVNSNSVLVVQSTVELEALRAGRKVYVVKDGAYMLMDYVFNEEGVYIIDCPDMFVKCYHDNKDEQLPPRYDLFVDFNQNMAESLLL